MRDQALDRHLDFGFLTFDFGLDSHFHGVGTHLAKASGKTVVRNFSITFSVGRLAKGLRHMARLTIFACLLGFGLLPGTQQVRKFFMARQIFMTGHAVP